MKDKEFVIEQRLRDIYYEPGTGFQSIERLYQKAKNDGLNVSRRIVREWLKTQETYTRYKPIVKKHKLMRPADVSKSNKDQVWVTLYRHVQGEFPIPNVRVSKYKNIFDKGYESNFTKEIFKVTKVLRGDPNMYELIDVDNEPIIGKEELSGRTVSCQ